MDQNARTSLPVINSQPLGDKPVNIAPTGSEPMTDEQIEAQVASFETSERERLGVKAARKQWTDSMLNPFFSKEERPKITLLISGLTKAQDFLVEGALRGVGYNVENIGCPDQGAYQTGKEYGNRAQCNPTYFTVGNLVQHLMKLRDEDGMETKEIIDKFVFLTAGACGPCRFGMYVTEYRKALRDAGFDGFRVMLFQQQGGLDQATGEEVGLELNPAFFISIVKAIVSGDVINALSYRIRPYEVERGATQRAIEEAKKIVYKALLQKTNVLVALYKGRKLFDAVKVDKLRPCPKVSIIGEFWAMTTEGEGNYHLQHFLESEGAECDIQLTTAWLLYNIWEVSRDTRERADLRTADGGQYGLEGHQGEFDVAQRLATLHGAEWALRVGFQAFALPPGLHGFHLPDMEKVAEVANEFYNNDLRGGEGHMEVGKLILNAVDNKCHMTLSVKPFGCMPSSGVSDGVQSLITSRYPGTVYCAVETDGDGATNFYSRVQMYLYKARLAAEAELKLTFEKAGVTRAQVEKFLEDNPEYASPLHHSPHVATGSASNLVYEVAPLILLSKAERRKIARREAKSKVVDAILATPGVLKRAVAKVTDPEFREAVSVDLELVSDLLRGKAKERYGDLVKRMMGKAYYENNSDFADETAEPLAAE
jgi:predicted nucleotide-binding protein (sugar kinase/HSP70/actin superfamily)